MAIKSTFIRRPTLLAVFRDATGSVLSTTLATAAAPGDTTISVASGTNAAVGPLRINDGEDIERVDVASFTGTTLTLSRPLRRAHAAGVQVQAQVCEDVGDVDGDVTLQMSRESTDQFSAMRFLTFGKLQGNASATLAGRFLGVTPDNFALACGMPRSTVVGAGTSIAAVKTLTTDFSNVDSINNMSIAVVAMRQDGTTTVFEFWGVNADYTQVSMQLARGQNGAIPFRYAVIGALAQFDGAPAFTAAQTYRANKGKLFKEISAVGIVSETGSATTVATAQAAGSTTLPLADASGIAANDWIVLGAEETTEVHWVASKAVNTLTLRTPLLRAQAVGVRVVKAVRTPFAAVTQGGMTFSVGGSTTPIIVENRVLPIGMQAQNANASATFSVNDINLSALARALGIPQSRISSNALVLSEQLLSTGIQAIYLEGLTNDGSVCILTFWGCTQDLANFSLAIGSSTAAALPYSVQPSSGVQLVQYAA